MRKIRRMIVLILVSIMAFALVGCGESSKYTVELAKVENNKQDIKVVIDGTLKEPIKLTPIIEDALNKTLEWYNAGKITALSSEGDNKILNGSIKFQSENYKTQIQVVFKNKKAYVYKPETVNVTTQKSEQLDIESDEIKGVLDTVNEDVDKTTTK